MFNESKEEMLENEENSFQAKRIKKEGENGNSISQYIIKGEDITKEQNTPSIDGINKVKMNIIKPKYK